MQGLSDVQRETLEFVALSEAYRRKNPAQYDAAGPLLHLDEYQYFRNGSARKRREHELATAIARRFLGNEETALIASRSLPHDTQHGRLQGLYQSLCSQLTVFNLLGLLFLAFLTFSPRN